MIDAQTRETHSPGVFTEFPTFGSIMDFIQEKFKMPVTGIEDNAGKSHRRGDHFDSPPFVIVEIAGAVPRRFNLQYL